jgi:hypothetical protein
MLLSELFGKVVDRPRNLDTISLLVVAELAFHIPHPTSHIPHPTFRLSKALRLPVLTDA